MKVGSSDSKDLPDLPRILDDVECNHPDADAKSTVGADEFLERLRGRSWSLHFIIVICALGWAANSFTLMTSAFFDTPHGTTGNESFVILSEEFGLIGEREYLREFTSSAYMVGNVIGGIVIAPASDAMGRRPVLILSLFGLTVMSLILSISPSAEIFIAARTIQGIFYTGLSQTSWVLAFECCPIKLRNSSATLFGMAWVIGYCSLAPIAMLADTWRTMMWIVAIPSGVLFVATVIAVPESLQYLVTRKGDSKKIAGWTKRINDSVHIATEPASKRVGICNYFTFPSSRNQILINMVIMSGLWASNAFIYFGLSFYSTSLSGNLYLNYILIGAIEAPAFILTKIFLKKFSRKNVMLGTHLMTGAAFVALLFLEKGSVPSLIGWVVGKLVISIAYMGIYVVGSEIFPTKVRSSALGICGTLSRIGGVFAPYVVTLARVSDKLPMMVFALVAFFGAVVSLFLPETKNKPLSEPTKDVQETSS